MRVYDADEMDPADCRHCKGTGIVLNGDGRPGWRQPRICHHDRTWHEMTPPERAQLAELLARLNRNPTR